MSERERGREGERERENMYEVNRPSYVGAMLMYMYRYKVTNIFRGSCLI